MAASGQHGDIAGVVLAPRESSLFTFDLPSPCKAISGPASPPNRAMEEIQANVNGLHGAHAVASEPADEDVLRANAYGLLSTLLLQPPSDQVLGIAKTFEGDESPFGQALAKIASCARRMTQDDIADEFTRLFYGYGAGGELHPYASYYLTGFIYERPLAELRADLDALGLAKSADVTTEPEDHIAIVMNAMHDLIMGAHDVAMDATTQSRFFDKHVATWSSRFFADLENADNAAFYKPVGTVGRLLMDIEGQAFAMSA